VDTSGNFILIGFSRIPRLVESGGFFVYRVSIGRTLILVKFCKIPNLVEFLDCGIELKKQVIEYFYLQ